MQPWIVDGHCDSIIDFVEGRRKLADDTGSGHWDLARAKRAGVGLQFMAAFIETKFKPNLATLRGLELVEAVHRFVAEQEAAAFLVQSRSDLALLPDGERVGVLLSIEGGEILGESLFLVDILHRLGVRAFGLTWNQRNALADGVGEIAAQSRLTTFGERVVRRLNDLGILVDVSHLNEPGFWHVLDISTQPIIASHSSAKALCDHRRNLSDEQLRALARQRGVVGVNFAPHFLRADGCATRADVVRHIQHIAAVAGVETVGLGSDFDGIETVPVGLEQVGDLPQLIEDLRSAGFNRTEIELICHGNFLRVLQEVLPQGKNEH